MLGSPDTTQLTQRRRMADVSWYIVGKMHFGSSVNAKPALITPEPWWYKGGMGGGYVVDDNRVFRVDLIQ